MGAILRIVNNKNAMMALAVLVGVLYVPAFVYGFFWSWTLAFVACTTILLRASLSHAINQSLRLDDIGKQSWDMSFRLFRLTMLHALICALPFVLILVLGMKNLLPEQNFDVSGSTFFAFAVVMVNLEFKSLDLQNHLVQFTLCLSAFMFLSSVSYLIFATRFALKARKVIFNVKLEPLDPKITMWGRDNKVELITCLILFLCGLGFAGVVLSTAVSVVEVSALLFSTVFFPVYTTIYTVTKFFMRARDIER